MPINARPEYFAAEKKYYQASTPSEKVKALEEMLKTAPAHKGAENLRAEIKQKLAKYRDMLAKDREKKGKGFSFAVKKEGAAQVVMVSVTNAGKSLLLSRLTNAKPDVADYEYTTTKPEIGIMDYGGIQVQIVEIPSLYRGFAYRGNGPQFLGIARNADLLLVLVDSARDEKTQMGIIYGELEKAQIRVDEDRPPIRVKKTGTGGIQFVGLKHIRASEEELCKYLQANGFYNAIIDFYGKVTMEDLADALNESLVYMKCLKVYTKSDITGKGISALKGTGIEKLKGDIWKSLGLIKVFTKTPGKEHDWPPIAFPKGSTIGNLAGFVHKDLLRKFKFARVWGKSAKFAGQSLGVDHVLQDGDIVEIHIK